MDKLDKKDKKLLFELDTNSRQSIQQLSKKIGLSKDAIQYRINKYIKEGIIEAFRATIDTGKLGLTGFRVLVKFHRTSPQKESQIIQHLLKNKHLVWAVRAEGKWDLVLWFPYKKIQDFNNDVWTKLLGKFGKYISKKEFSISSKIIYFSRDFLIEKENSKKTLQVPITSLPIKVTLDNKDLEILKILTKNARSSIVNISKKINLTTKTTLNKIRKLEKQEVIVAYRTSFNMNKLGYNHYKLDINIFNPENKKIEEIKEFVIGQKNLLYWNELIGGKDIEIDMQTKTRQELTEFINKFKEKFGNIIKNYEILMYYKTLTERYFPTI